MAHMNVTRVENLESEQRINSWSRCSSGLLPMNYRGWAEAYGAYAAAPKSLEELPEVLAQAFKADRPTLIYLTPQTAV